jgi:uncharacterized protein
MPTNSQDIASRMYPSWISECSDGLRLLGSKDLKTGKCIFPAIPDSSPSASRYKPIRLSRRGVIYSYTVIHPNPKSGEKPFALAYVDLPESARIFGRLVLGLDQPLEIGMQVDVRIEDGEAVTYHFTRANEIA